MSVASCGQYDRLRTFCQYPARSNAHNVVRARYGARVRFDLLSAKPLRAAVIKARPDLQKVPSERMFRRYIGEDTPWPDWLRVEVEKIMGIAKEPPGPPEWVEGLEAKLVAEIRENRTAIFAGLAGQIGEAVADAIAGLQQPPPDGPAPSSRGRAV